MRYSPAASRKLSNPFTLALLALLAFACQPGQRTEPAEGIDKKPNVLFIIIDDLKPLLGCYGDPYAVSPHIDRLAARGTLFQRNYCQQAICGPSRANLLTGLRPDHVKLWTLDRKMRNTNPDLVALPEHFRNNGYTTAGIGKVFDPRCVDAKRDEPSWSIPFFDRSDAYYAPGAVRNSRFQHPANLEKIEAARKVGKARGLSGSTLNRLVKNLANPTTESADVPDNAYIDGANTDHAIDILGDLSAKDEPFFLAVGITKPHLPFAAPQKYWELYDRETLPLAEFRDNSQRTPDLAFHEAGEIRSYVDIINLDEKGLLPGEQAGLELPLDKQQELIHGYYAATSYADALVGKLTAALDSLELDDNTIVVVVGDHGWHLGDHNLWCKHSNFENAVRTPFILSAPGYAASETGAMSEFVDVFPTLCELAGLDAPAQLDGQSLVPILNDPAAAVKDYAVSQYPRNNLEVMGYSLRTPRYRYAVWVDKGFRSTEAFDEDLVVGRELYDYQTDPLERVNLVGEDRYAAEVADLHAAMLEWMAAQRE